MTRKAKKIEESFARASRYCLTNQDYSKKSDDELRFILRDASEAADAMRGWDDAAEAKYLEQIDDAATVLAERARDRAHSLVSGDVK